ncbi:NAD-dependent epimerase/dehydratase family protein [Saccharothrix sp. ST-888]|uniref:NAD-dependent epimerase/dehydratase family protein n=1 Tax=Saccharothrix sp. ST-888 TaxID=1427391 RepID=UPI000697DCAC|nr:NAD(P)H-binding protein [Saccharothrix sp. ST-888]
MTVLVVGGTGFLGRSVVTELLDRGHRVTALSRREPLQDGPPGARSAVADAERLDVTGWAGLLAGHDAVVFAAGRDDRTVPPAPAAAYFHRGNVVPVERLTAAARQVGCRSVVVLGSYFSTLDRERPQRELARHHPYIRSRVEQAAAARRAGGSEVAVAVLEIPFVFGAPTPGRGSLWAPALPWLRSRWPLFAPPGGTAVVSVTAVAQAAATAVEGALSGDFPVALANLGWPELLRRLAPAAGRPGPVRVLPAPAAPLHLAMRTLGLVHRLHHRQPGLAAHLAGPLLTSGLYLDTAVCRTRLGVTDTDLDRSFRETFTGRLAEQRPGGQVS